MFLISWRIVSEKLDPYWRNDSEKRQLRAPATTEAARSVAIVGARTSTPARSLLACRVLALDPYRSPGEVPEYPLVPTRQGPGIDLELTLNCSEDVKFSSERYKGPFHVAA